MNDLKVAKWPDICGAGTEPVAISDSEFARVRALAMDMAGIHLASSKKDLVVGRWSRRLAHHNLDSFDAYLALLAGDRSGELQIAIDLLTTNETSFFREPKHFEFLRRNVLPAARAGGRFGVWSAACSSGEEAYSVAMTLAAELPHSPWEVMGTDISTRVLTTARAGIYDLERAKQIPREYLQHYCLKGKGPQGGKFMITQALRERTKFHHANLVEPMPDFGRFDVILLRNVLFYFDAATKEKVVRHLVPALKPGGYFIIGHCDSLGDIEHALTPIGPSIYQSR